MFFLLCGIDAFVMYIINPTINKIKPITQTTAINIRLNISYIIELSISVIFFIRVFFAEVFIKI